MSLLRDESAEATVISQLLIIGITAGIVFAAATYAYFAIDEAIDEADQAAAALTLRGAMHRIDGLAQQGTGASGLVGVPSGAVSFSPFWPPGPEPDRLVIIGLTEGFPVRFDGLDDGDAAFHVDTDRDLVLDFNWYWGPGDRFHASASIQSGGTYSTPSDRALDGTVSITAYDADDEGVPRVPLAIAIVADQHVLETTEAALLGNLVIDAERVRAHVHSHAATGLGLRVWSMAGTSFASERTGQLHVTVSDQAWIAQAAVVQVDITAVGERAAVMRGFYESQGGNRDGDTVRFEVDRLDILGTALVAEVFE